jgi:hypothetical protein
MENKLGLSKSHDKMPKGSKQKVQKQSVKDENEDKEKERLIKEALSERKVMILTGMGNSKLHSIKKWYK